jgi:multidrug efflux pump subunit AcrB
MEKHTDKAIEKINKLSMPATILIASVVLGGFYFSSELIKQSSIERQQKAEIQAKIDAEQQKTLQQTQEKLGKSLCVSEAEANAVALNTEACARGEYCVKGEGMYLVAQYDTAYKTCLQRKGLE